MHLPITILFVIVMKQNYTPLLYVDNRNSWWMAIAVTRCFQSWSNPTPKPVSTWLTWFLSWYI